MKRDVCLGCILEKYLCWKEVLIKCGKPELGDKHITDIQLIY